MNSLGIYFGIKDINLVEVGGKKVVNNIRLPHPSAGLSDLEEKVPGDIKLVAVLKDAFRTYRINANEAIFCVSGQDMVIRTFEIPALPQSELKSAINFEVKKYIPFKIESLDYDFQILHNPKTKTNLVLFVGIKKEILNSYVSIAKQLNLKVDAVEYSAFSMLRFLKLSGASDSGVIANLNFDLTNEDEANFTVFENGFPLFSRDIVLEAAPADFETIAQSGRLQKQEKLKNEIRVSLDYYKRKFPDKNIKNIFVISDPDSRQELEGFFAEAGLSVKFINTQKVFGSALAYSSAFAKSFSASSFKSSALKIKIDLVGAKLKADKALASTTGFSGAGLSGVNPLAFLEGYKLDFRFVLVGVLACALVFGYRLVQTHSLQGEISKIQEKRVKISSPLADDSYETLNALDEQYKEKIKVLDSLVKNKLYATYPLNVIPRAIPEGVWLSRFDLNKDQNGVAELTLRGQASLTDNQQEFEAINAFFSNLKRDPEFAKYFSSLTIDSLDRGTVQGKSMTTFTISCKNPKKKE